MPNIRKTSMQKYNISSHRYLELYHFCMQYEEWVDELKYKCDTVKGITISDMPKSHQISRQTEDLAIRRAELQNKCQIVEKTAIEADDTIYPYLIKAVTNEGVTYNYLKEICGIPCGKDMYYDRRRKFYFLLSKKI